MAATSATSKSDLMTTNYLKALLGQEEKGGTVAILRKLCGAHFLALSDMLFPKIYVGVSGSAGNVAF